VDEGSVSEVDTASILNVEMCNLGEPQCMQVCILVYVLLCLVNISAGWFLVRSVAPKGAVYLFHSFPCPL
jgi:hypothetical protein